MFLVENIPLSFHTVCASETTILEQSSTEFESTNVKVCAVLYRNLFMESAMVSDCSFVDNGTWLEPGVAYERTAKNKVIHHFGKFS